MEIAFACEYCGEILATEEEEGYASSDEHHTCFGEKVGYIGEVTSKGVILDSGIEIVTNPNL